MKPFFKGIGILSGILILLFVLVLFNINTVVETAVNHFGPRITKTPTTLGGRRCLWLRPTCIFKISCWAIPKGFPLPTPFPSGLFTWISMKPPCSMTFW